MSFEQSNYRYVLYINEIFPYLLQVRETVLINKKSGRMSLKLKASRSKYVVWYNGINQLVTRASIVLK